MSLAIAIRRLLRQRSFTIIAVLTLALGIGVNSAVFSLVNAVMLRPLPFRDQDRLVSIHETRNGSGDNGISAHEFIAWNAANNVIDQATMYRSFELTLLGRGDATPVKAVRTAANFFDVFGTSPALGMGFRPGDDSSAASPVVVLSHRYWRERFNADSSIVGTDITLNDRAFRVLGVMRSSGEFDPDVWITLDVPAEALTVGRHALAVVARLKPGITTDVASRELNAISERLERELPQFNTGHRPQLISVYEDVVGDARRAVYVVLGAVALVLLIACANVAHLLLARAAGRRREIAICAAVGASRKRLIAQMLTDSVLVSLAGGALGLLLAVWIVALLPGIPALQIPRLAEMRVDATVIVVTFGIALLTGVVSGLVPAFRASRVSLMELISDGARTSAGASRRTADALVISEIALALVLLVGAGLLLKSFSKLTRVQPGFNADNVLVVSAALGSSYRSPASQRDAFDEISRRLAALPGVAQVGATSAVPLMMCCNGNALTIEGAPAPKPGSEPTAMMQSVTDSYFAAMQIPLREGRAFAASDARIALPLMLWWPEQPRPAGFDTPQAAPVALINETAARMYWPDGNVIGRRFRIIASPWITIIGVVADVHHRGLGADAPPQVYLAQSQEPLSQLALVIRTTGSPMALASAVRAELRSFDRALRVSSINTMDEVVHDSVGQPRFNALALGAFAALALALALIGIYGVISNAVAQRTREIGIRTALGADARDTLTLVLGRAAVLTAAGVVLGLIASRALSGVLTKLLFGVQPTDSATFAVLAAVLALTSMLASYIPARRALRVDPLIALRGD